ncbi:MAG: T9SS type A sorting domain-containing protein [Bacteroidia bacterium]|nr:T9SS type A sorting domain-containing protein [Bacteroidia bacterium]MCZ2276980.1 T9SS type A sorting domain-containing protein [Bacteroidia bacterium]
MKRIVLFFLSVLPIYGLLAWSNGQERIFFTQGSTLVKGIIRTYDGGYALAGSVDSTGFGDSDFFLIKLDSAFQPIWAFNYGSKQDETCFTLKQAVDSGFILAGYSTSFGNGSKDAFIIKTNYNGVPEWSRVINGNLEDRFTGCEPQPDGTILCIGNTKSAGAGDDDILIVKFDSFGDTLWTRMFGGPVYDAGISVTSLSGGGYVMSGRVYSFGNGLRDACLLKTDDNGNLQWFRTYGGPNTDEGMIVKQTSDCGFLMSGASESFSASGKYDVYVVRTDSLGGLLWSRAYGGDEIEGTYDFIENADGGFTILGFSESFGSNRSLVNQNTVLGDDDADVFLIRINSQGDTLWTRTLGGALFDEAYSLIPADSASLIIGAYSRSFSTGGHYDAYVLIVDSTGVSHCNTGYQQTQVIYPVTIPMIHTPSVASGISVLNPVVQSAGLVYHATDPCLYSSVHIVVSGQHPVLLIQNPFGDAINLKFNSSDDFKNLLVRICDMNGSKVAEIKRVHEPLLRINTQSFKAGVYIIEITGDRINEKIKAVKTY